MRKLEPLSLASLIQLLSGLSPDVILYSDAQYSIGSIGGSYYPKLEAKAFGKNGLSFHSVLSVTPVTVGEFLNFLQGSVQYLANEGHAVDMDCHIWMSFGRFGMTVVNEGEINGLSLNYDGSYTLQRTKTDFQE